MPFKRRHSYSVFLAFKRDQERKGTTNGGVTPEVISTKSTVSSSMDKWSSKGSSSLRQKSSRRNPLSLSHESLVVIDQDPSQQKLASANSVNSIVNHVAKTLEQEQVGRVASWAVSFDKLLNDTIGISVFTDFLKKEFSEENIVFWKACENFRNIVDSNYRKSKAKEIYDTYVSARAPDAVNIDSVARKHVEGELEDPTPQTFDIAQTQIFQLMKQDSYARFLKGDLYKSWLMKEMEGEPIELASSDEPTDKNKLLDRAQEKEGKKKGKGKENEENKDKRRRSLLPWRQKSKKTSKLDSETKNSKSSKDKEPETNGVVKSTPTTASTGTTTSTSTEAISSRKEPVQIVEVPETIDEEPEQPKFCRVIMPDGSTTVVGTKQGQTINYVLGKLCEKRGLSIASVDVFLLGSEKPLNLNEDISTLGSKEVTIERRVLFRMDLPNKKCIGVKAKPNRLIRDVFKPILSKYGYRIDAIDVHLNGETELLGLDSLVSSIDGQRVIVLTQVTDNPDLPEAVGKVKKEDERRSLDSCVPERTGQLAAGEVSARDTGKTGRSRQKVTFALQKNTVRNRPNEVDDPETLYARLKRAQELSLDDQRGLVPPALELPDFLQDSSGRTILPGGRESAPASLNRVGERCNSPVDRMSDYSKEMENYLEDINENFAAYTRESTPNKQLNTRNPLFGGDARYISMFSTFVSPSGKLKATDKSFSEDGVIPSHEEADNLFQVSAPDNVDFDDPHLTDKSLTDIGFSYGYNKYLSKSRNFADINQRQKGPHKKQLHGDPVLVSADSFSPNQTVQNDSRDHSDLLESTLLHSPLSSPYESDSSTDKENLSKYVPKSGVRNVQRASRHTLLHSPINTGGGDSFLSTVDTDGKLTRHSTPNVTPIKALSQSSPVKDMDLTVRKSHTEEVTFV